MEEAGSKWAFIPNFWLWSHSAPQGKGPGKQQNLKTKVSRQGQKLRCLSTVPRGFPRFTALQGCWHLFGAMRSEHLQDWGLQITPCTPITLGKQRLKPTKEQNKGICFQRTTKTEGDQFFLTTTAFERPGCFGDTAGLSIAGSLWACFQSYYGPVMDILLQKQFHVAIICFVAIITSLCYCCTWVLHCISAAEAHTHTHTCTGLLLKTLILLIESPINPRELPSNQQHYPTVKPGCKSEQTPAQMLFSHAPYGSNEPRSTLGFP